MAVLNENLYGKLLHNKNIGKLNSFATTKGGELDLMWGSSKATVDYFYDSNILPTEDLEEARFLNLADYMTYVPYGTTGYKKLQELLQKKGNGKTVSEYRYNMLQEIMGKDLTSLPENQKNYIKSFFDNYYKEEVNLKSVPEVVSLIGRVHHECEANFKKLGYTNLSEIDERTNNFSDYFAGLYDSKETINASEILNEIPKVESLKDIEVEFLKNFTGLESNPNEKQP